jgi:hypothetical protein
MLSKNMIAPVMRTGLALDEIVPIESSLMRRIESLLYTFMERATVHAATYVTEGNRNTLTTMDMIFGLKYCAHTFFHEDDFEASVDANLAQDDDEATDDDDEATDDDDETTDDDETDDPFVRNETSTNPLVVKMNHYADEWDTWCPTDEVEVMVKRAIDKMEAQSDLGL